VTGHPDGDGGLGAELDQLFAQWDRPDAPGLVVGVARGDTILYRRGFGLASIEAAVPNTPATRIRIGSTSKHFTSLLALLLAEDGKLELDRPARHYLPALEGPAGDATLRQLMQHRGGLRCHLDLGFITHGLSFTPMTAALECQARQRERNFPTGTAMIYNNSGYHLLSLVIEQEGGAPFEQQLHDRLFVPVGMHATASIPSDYEIHPGVATLHLPGAHGGWRRGIFPTENILGEGAIVSTIDDMLRWTAHLRTRDRFGSAVSWAALTTPEPHRDGTPATYALGLIAEIYRGQRLLHHPGGVTGGSSAMTIVPDQGLDIVIISNGAADAAPLALSYQVIDIVLRECLDAPAQGVRTDIHADCMGDWWSAETGMLYTLFDKNGVAGLRICGGEISGELTMAGARRAVLVELSVGEIDFDLDLPRNGGRMIIGFAGSKAAYDRVAPAGGIAPSFADRVIGRYASSDADAVAEIARKDGALRIRIADAHGFVEADLRQLGRSGLALTAKPDAFLHPSVLSFPVDDDTAEGFTLNSIRTRNLAFARVGS
jgi:D-aminopeptidase